MSPPENRDHLTTNKISYTSVGKSVLNAHPSVGAEWAGHAGIAHKDYMTVLWRVLPKPPFCQLKEGSN